MNADEERAMRAAIASAPDQYARPHRPDPVSATPLAVAAERARNGDAAGPLAIRETLTRMAVIAERERCAKIAEEMADDPHGSNPARAAAEEIAARIRSGE